VDSISDSALAERVEAEWMYRVQRNAPEEVGAVLGMASIRLGGGVVTAMRSDPANYWSKALGFGFDIPVDRALVSKIAEFYLDHSVPSAVLQFAPAVLPDDWAKICATHALADVGYWVKWAHDLKTISTPLTDLRVAEVEPASATPWASVLLRGFGMPEGALSRMLVPVVGQPGFRCFAAWDGTDIVAVGNMFVLGDAAGLWADATLGSHQRRGAQSALLSTRLLAAREAGCRVAYVETEPNGPRVPNPSFRNMRRAGFIPLYRRRNWQWRSTSH
jgi:GNAT superfamily N-acetyltransferase